MRRATAVVIAFPLLSSCAGGPAPLPEPVVREEARHAHADGCGHFFENGRWREWPEEHVHGPDCGHVRAHGGYGFFPTGHEHGPTCGHFLVDEAWQPFPREHVHGEGCGHSFFDGMWNPFPAAHRHDAACGHLLRDGAWTCASKDPGHQHSPGCGHRPLGDGVWVETQGERTFLAAPRGFARGLFRHGGGLHAAKAGARPEWTIPPEAEDHAGIALRPNVAALGGDPVGPRH